VDEPTLVILTGPPGAGKSTVGRLVAAEYDPSVCIHSDWAYTTIVNGFIRQWEPESDPQNRAVIRSSIAMAARLVEGGYFTVIEGIFGPWYLDLIRDELDGHQIRLHYVVLRPDIEKCLERAQKRPQLAKVAGHHPLADSEPIRLLWNTLSNLGEYESHVIDNTNMSASRAAKAICKRVEEGSEVLATTEFPNQQL
jgi:predicted ABC-type ATPase